MQRLAVVIADDQRQVRSALRLLLEEQSDLSVVAEVDEAGSLVAQVHQRQPHLVLLDWELPGGPIEHLLVTLRAVCHHVRVIVLSSWPERRPAALRAGVDAFVCKGDPADQVLRALQRVSQRVRTVHETEGRRRDRPMKARDIMTADVIAVEADATVEEVARLLVQHRIGAVPVLDADRQVLGIVYQEQLFLRPKHVPFSTTKLPALLDTWVNPEELADEYQAIKQHPVAEIMREAVCVEADEKVGATAVLMAERDLSHVLVLTGDRLVGIISQTDIIELMTQD